ncbi:hypothetical protein TNCV_3357511 [Trichonephila clavipes]|nr:hypothetical protein TNCV_3357511 [Trichonephila clavipes]
MTHEHSHCYPDGGEIRSNGSSPSGNGGCFEKNVIIVKTDEEEDKRSRYNFATFIRNKNVGRFVRSSRCSGVFFINLFSSLHRLNIGEKSITEHNNEMYFIVYQFTVKIRERLRGVQMKRDRKKYKASSNRNMNINFRRKYPNRCSTPPPPRRLEDLSIKCGMPPVTAARRYFCQGYPPPKGSGSSRPHL